MFSLIVTANVVMILLVLGIASGVLPRTAFSGAVTILHKIIGITLPSPDKDRIVAVIWLASALLIADGILFLLIVLARSVGGS